MSLRVRGLTATGDMTFGNGSSNYLINTSAAVAQIVKTSLNLWVGEWFLAKNAGVPWSTSIIGRNTLPIAIMIIRNAILNVPGVVSIGSVNFVADPTTRTLSVTISNVSTLFSGITGVIPSISIPINLLDVVNGAGLILVNKSGSTVVAPNL